jgi:hypothetical protein
MELVWTCLYATRSPASGSLDGSKWMMRSCGSSSLSLAYQETFVPCFTHSAWLEVRFVMKVWSTSLGGVLACWSDQFHQDFEFAIVDLVLAGNLAVTWRIFRRRAYLRYQLGGPYA